MADSMSYFRGVNLGLSVAVAVVIAAASITVLGPGRGLVARVRAQMDARVEDFRSWQRDRSSFRRVDDAERARWTSLWQGFLDRIPIVSTDPELMARVASDFDAPSASDVEVQRLAGGRAGEDGADAPVRVTSPIGEEALQVEAIPVQVSFRSSYRDAVNVLRRLETHSIPARVEALEIRRDFPNVGVQLELTYFVREGMLP